MIQVPAVIERCAGIDVGKREIAVAVITGPSDEEGEVKTRAFDTTVPALERLRDWLVAEGCTSVAMESTGSYWVPVKNVLESSVRIVLVCPRDHHPKRGDKTDFRDAHNLAHLHRLLRGSFLPERRIVELRDLTRRRKKVQGHLSAEKNRIQKILEASNVKIGNIVSDVFGVSGQAMVSVLISGQEVHPEQIAELSKRRLRQRIPELIETLKGHRMNEHHRGLIQQSVDHAVLLDRQLEELESRIEEKLQPWQREYELLQTIPGVKEMIAACILAEVGGDMSQFHSAKHLCSWAGICPGNNRSAGKSKHSRIRKANRFLLAALVQAGWAAARKRDSIFQRKFQLGEEVGRSEDEHRDRPQPARNGVRDAESAAGLYRTGTGAVTRDGKGQAGAPPRETTPAVRSRRDAHIEDDAADRTANQFPAARGAGRRSAAQAP